MAATVTNDFMPAAAVVGASQTLENTGTAVTDHAFIEVKVSGTSGGDPHARFTIPGGTSWYAGVDNSDGDKLIIGTGAAVGTNPIVTVVSAGRVGIGADATSPSHPLHVIGSGSTAARIEVTNSLATSFAMFEQETTGGAAASMRAYGASSAGTFFGMAAAGAAVFMGQPQANATMLGSFGNFPVLLGVNNAEAARLRKDADTADGETVLAVRRNVGGAFTVQTVSMGAADSGGVGFKLLRVPN